MLDLLFLAGVIALFVLVGLFGTAVERLGPPASRPAGRAETGREARR